jgi:hypothetical protein
VDTKCTALSLIPTGNGNTVRSFSTHGQQSAAKGSSTTVSRSDTRLIQYLDSSAHGLVRRWLLIGYFPTHLLPLTCLNLFEPSAPWSDGLMVRKWSTVPISLSYTTPHLRQAHEALQHADGGACCVRRSVLRASLAGVVRAQQLLRLHRQDGRELTLHACSTAMKRLGATENGP